MRRRDTSSVSVDVDDATTAPLTEAHEAVSSGEQRVIATPTDVLPRMETGAALAHEDGAGRHGLPVEPLHAQPLGTGIPAIAS